MAISSPSSTESRFARLLRTQGIARPIAWGFVALTIFMIGDGIEAGFLSPYLDQQGFDAGQITALWATYGIVVAAAAWLSGALAEAWGPKRVMMLGFGIWVVFQVLFLVFGVMAENFSIMLLAFGIRGFGYPMFAYGFLVWVTMGTPENVMGKAVGWYWFFSTLGLGVLSSYFAGAIIPVIGELATLWLSLAFVTVGGLMVALLLRNPVSKKVTVANSLRGVVSSITIVGTNPKIGIGGIVRLINTLSFYAFVVFLTTYMVRDVGFAVAEWQVIWGTMLAANVAANLISGYLSDWIGRVNVVAWAGGIGCFVTILALYYVPTAIGPNFAVTIAIAIAYGLALGMFVPLSAIVPLLAPMHKAAAVAILNLGAGLSQFIGPVIAGLVTPIGIQGTIWVIASLYLVGFVLTFMLKPSKPGVTADQMSSASSTPAPIAT
ncbi:MFS transporter [Pseudoclavibacter sp. RFBJ3]|uniref:MFS transporter n=1 Tax=unclassified Pseudoclavibacter TaxID=2615177 RepID=UPI000CE89CD7|nr:MULTISPECIES: MFS transporter [unclassified Pseudoclavibacter]PPF81483.1 MFS transporter [Pseudoclavibacter sp. RFBJ5]PPF90814.1 MFS transporter [Pseudoclavibacter sp. RFBJ3]PPG00090.1 MFS transporter [Pseudoclavibacter sp. RFBH5]PPG19947.1 MFS transporter [Pseudoclavibacter sp. RFBI4]